MITPSDFLRLIIGKWEGSQYQSYADDLGNWITLPDGSRRNLGTKYGVTPEALALHRGLAPWELTPVDMQTLQVEEAVAIGEQHYYREVHFDLLDWGPTAASVLDFGWMSGPCQAALSLQRLVGTFPDGEVGPQTADAFAVWQASLGAAGAVQAVHDMRADFFRHLAVIRPANQQFLEGWLRRDDWASAVNSDWEKLWV